MQQLRARRASFGGMRSLMRIRATVKGKTQSFRAQLAVHDAQRMELIAYTPVGTTAMTMKADGNRITSDPPAAPEAFAFLRDAETIAADENFGNYGFDSITFIELSNAINAKFSIDVTPAMFFEHDSLARVAAYILRDFGDVTGA